MDKNKILYDISSYKDIEKSVRNSLKDNFISLLKERGNKISLTSYAFDGDASYPCYTLDSIELKEYSEDIDGLIFLVRYSVNDYRTSSYFEDFRSDELISILEYLVNNWDRL